MVDPGALCDELIEAAARGVSLEDAIALLQRRVHTSREAVLATLDVCRARSTMSSDPAVARAEQLLMTALELGIFPDRTSAPPRSGVSVSQSP